MPMTGKKLQAALQRAGARCETAAASISSAPEETVKSRTADARYAFMSGPLFSGQSGWQRGNYSRPFVGRGFPAFFALF